MNITLENLNLCQQNKILQVFFKKLAALPNNLVFFVSLLV